MIIKSESNEKYKYINKLKKKKYRKKFKSFIVESIKIVDQIPEIGRATKQLNDYKIRI